MPPKTLANEVEPRIVVAPVALANVPAAATPAKPPPVTASASPDKPTLSLPFNFSITCFKSSASLESLVVIVSFPNDVFLVVNSSN